MIKTDNNKVKETITFVPFYGIGNRAYYNSLYYFEDKQIDFQLSLIELFSQFEQYNFIIKCVKTHPFAQFSKITKDWISLKKYTNICYRDDKLKNSLLLSDKVIMDFPGSSVFEVAHHNIEALVLYYDGLNIRETAIGLSKKIIVKKYTDINSGVKIVEHFLLNNLQNPRTNSLGDKKELN